MKYRMAKVLIIDDEMQLRRLLSRIIGLEGYEVAEAADCASGMKMLRQHEPDVVLCDVKLPDGSGVELVSRIKEAAPAVEVILMTAYGNIPDGVQAIKNGAFDYITKGDDNNKILPLLSRASEKAQMQRRLARFEDKLSEENSFDRVIGSSAALREAVELARKVAVTDTSVLLTGETGTGKEVFARAIHHASRRAHEAFVAVNCSAFSKELLESELFPVVTIIIMEAFINKMRRLKGVRKQLIVEEAWKALSSANMAEYLRYMYKTVRKYYGEAIVVTQEVDDIISSPVVKESIINNSDCKILLDQRKYMNKFDQIQALLGLTEKEKSQILSINMANNPSRLYKEVWIGLGGTQSAVYATEVSAEEYLAYTTEETEKVEVYRLAEKLGGDIEAAIRQLAEKRRNKETTNN